MNKKLILELADWIEKSETFLQTHWFWKLPRCKEDSYCGTPACIAGHCVVMSSEFSRFAYETSNMHFIDMDGDIQNVSVFAEEMMGLEGTQGMHLFSMAPVGNAIPTAEDAARTLRYLAATREVDWTVTEEQVEQALMEMRGEA